MQRSNQTVRIIAPVSPPMSQRPPNMFNLYRRHWYCHYSRGSNESLDGYHERMAISFYAATQDMNRAELDAFREKLRRAASNTTSNLFRQVWYAKNIRAENETLDEYGYRAQLAYSTAFSGLSLADRRVYRERLGAAAAFL